MKMKINGIIILLTMVLIVVTLAITACDDGKTPDTRTPPTEPLNFTAVPHNGEVALSWDEPADNGGAEITKYEVAYSTDGNFSYVEAATSTSHTFGTLTNFTTYTFRVRAVNAKGAGSYAETTAMPVAFELHITGWTYNETPNEPSVTVDGEPYDGTLSFTYSKDDVTYKVKDEVTFTAGTWWVKTTIPAKENEYPATTIKQSFTIAKAQVAKPTLTGETIFDYTGNEFTVTVSSYNSELITVTGLTGTNAGNYNAVVSLKDENNYKWTDGDSNPFNLPWSIKGIQVTKPTIASQTSNTYTGSPITVTVSTYDSNLITVTGNLSETNAGNYTLTVSLKNKASCQWADTEDSADFNLPWSIAQFEAALSWSGHTGLVYDKTEKNVTATVSNKIGTDTVNVTVTGGTQTNAGTHTATATALSNANYKLPASVTQSYTIGQKAITWGNPGTVNSKPYDGTTAATVATQPTLSGVISGDTVTVTNGTVTFDNANAGTSKTITAIGFGIGGASSGNYSISGQPTFTAGTITKINPTVTWPTGLTAAVWYKLEDTTITSGTGAGTFSWTTPSADVGAAGSRAHNMTFTPNDIINYNIINSNVTITIIDPPYTYTITGSGTQFTATRGGFILVVSQPIQTVVDTIKTNAIGVDVTINFGEDSILDIGTANIEFNNNENNWGLISLQGSVTSANETATQGTILISNGTILNSITNITNTATTAVYNNNSTININGGTILASGTDRSAIVNYLGTTNIYSGTISATAGTNSYAVLNNGKLNIYDGLITATNGYAIRPNLSSAETNIYGGIISATSTTRSAIVNTTSGTIITISGENALITSRNNGDGTILIGGGKLIVESGTIENTSTNTNARAITGAADASVTINGGTITSGGSMAISGTTNVTINGGTVTPPYVAP